MKELIELSNFLNISIEEKQAFNSLKNKIAHYYIEKYFEEKGN